MTLSDQMNQTTLRRRLTLDVVVGRGFVYAERMPGDSDPRRMNMQE